MAWVITPPAQTDRVPPGWAITPVVPAARTPGQGWFAFTPEEVTISATPHGSGALSAAAMKVAFIYPELVGDGVLAGALLARPALVAELDGDGALSGSYTLVQTTSPQFAGVGILFGFGIPETSYPDFDGEGSLAATTDGLTATMVPTDPRFPNPNFVGEGSLAGFIDGLTATVVAL